MVRLNNHQKYFWEVDQFKIIVENSTDLIAAVDERGDFLYVSPSHKKVLGYSSKELVGRNSFTIIHPKDRHRTYLEFQKGLRRKKTFVSEFIALHKNGSEVSLEATASALVMVQGNPVFIVVIRDISQRRELEKKKEEFISVAHHELKTPLTSIHAFAQLLQQSTKESRYEMLKKPVNMINSEVVKLNALVKRLVCYSEIQLGKVRLNKSPVQVTALLHETVMLFNDTERNIRIENQFKRQKLSIDESLMRDTLYHIIHNALKYSKSPSKVIVRTSKRGAEFRIHVEDFGRGIDKSERKRIAKQFYQSDPPQTYIIPGFGLGLYLASELLKLHGGYLDIQPNKKKGTIVTLCLPI